MIKRAVYVLMLLCILPGSSLAADGLLVPPGNRNSKQPPVPEVSAQRTKMLATSYDAKYQKIYDMLQQNTRLRKKILRVAAAYDIAPVHIVAAIVGEHTYNVGAHDQLQTYYIKGIAWAGENVSFSYQGEAVSDFVKRPQFSGCQGLVDSYKLWTCRETVWDQQFRGKTTGGKSWPDNRFSAVFFQPYYAGQSFGLGQVNPLTALKVSDLVHEKSGLPKLDADHGAALYRTIMDTDSTIPYIAAIIRKSIDAYQQNAGFDISQNPGITATLYNLGGEIQRARALAEENARRKARGKALLLPQENYYGWFVNTKQQELEQLFAAQSQ